MSFDIKFMKKAIEIAEKGRGKTSPNPFVGAIVVKDEKIVGTGFTQPWGNDHAEIQAIKEAGNKCEGADLYVTLEPCSHFGKTPPCVDEIIKKKFKAVYAGIKDPNPKVNGNGFKKLRDAGINLKTNILEKKITNQLEYYLKFIQDEKPFCILKTAITLDGKIACKTGDSKWITSSESRKFVHELRNEVDVILTGIGTVLNDNPTLNVRDAENFISNPIRAILDSKLRIPVDSKIVKTADEIETVVFYSIKEKNNPKIKKLKEKNVKLFSINENEFGLNLEKVLDYFYIKNLYTILIEAGPSINTSFIKENLVDKYFVFVAPKIVGGDKNFVTDLGIKKMKNCKKLVQDDFQKIGDDILLTFYPKK